MNRARGFYASAAEMNRAATNPRLRQEDLEDILARVARREEQKARRRGAQKPPETPVLFNSAEASELVHTADALRMEGLDELAADALMDAIAVMAGQVKYVLDHADERTQRRVGDEWEPA
jgi:hypothetical protein